MAFVITEPCVSTCDTACVEVCPVDCIHGPFDKEGAGAEAKVDGFNPECPVEAIFSDDELPEEWEHYLKINEEFFSE